MLSIVRFSLAQGDDPWVVRILAKVHWGAHPAGLDNLFPDDPRIGVMHHFLGSWKVLICLFCAVFSSAACCLSPVFWLAPCAMLHVTLGSLLTLLSGRHPFVCAIRSHPGVIAVPGQGWLAEAPHQHRRHLPPRVSLVAQEVRKYPLLHAGTWRSDTYFVASPGKPYIPPIPLRRFLNNWRR